jgi:hypothetical protein
VEEESVRLDRRYLWLEGRLLPRLEAKIRRGLPVEWPSSSRICLVGYVYATLPLPKDFDTMFAVNLHECKHDFERDCLSFRLHHLANAVAVHSRILAATHQFNIPDKEMAGGWKTVCLIDFPAGVPQMIEELPEVEGWGESRQWVCLCDYPTWAALVEMEPC